MSQPQIKPGDWIDVEGQACVVSRVFPPELRSGAGQVVYNKAKPTTKDVEWKGNAWRFVESGDFGGYGRTSDQYVQQLKHGRNRHS